MPYIEKEIRDTLSPTLNAISEKIHTVGTLNYAITELCLNFVTKSAITYTSLNEIVGVLESAKLEFYRRAVSTYEDKKIDSNGDVYK